MQLIFLQTSQTSFVTRESLDIGFVPHKRNFPKLSVNPHSIRVPGGAVTTSDTPLGSWLAWSDTIAENDIRCLKQEIKSAGPARIFLYIDYEFSQVMV